LAKRKARSLYFTPEPDWEKYAGITDQDAMLKAFQEVQYFVRTEIKDKDKISYTKAWIKNESGWDSADIKKILKCPDYVFNATSTTFYSWNKLGFIPDSIVAHIQKRRIDWLTQGKKAIQEAEAKKEEKPKRHQTIQQRMKEQVSHLLGDWEGKLDDFISGEQTLADFDPYKDMLVFEGGIVKPAHAKIIRDSVDGSIEEAHEIIAWKCDQIKEGFAFMTPKFRKEHLKWFEKIQTACDTIIETGKANRKPRKKRLVSKEKMVTKLKFQVNESTLGIASIPAEEIVYANEVWVYNTKSRKIGVYKANNPDPRSMKRQGAGLTVKGTTILDFNSNASVQKTLRKPVDQIKNWTGNAKTKFNKAFDEIKAVETKLTGRLNNTTIILKAF
jgi:hypothetical protein